MDNCGLNMQKKGIVTEYSYYWRVSDLSLTH